MAGEINNIFGKPEKMTSIQAITIWVFIFSMLMTLDYPISVLFMIVSFLIFSSINKWVFKIEE